MEEVGGCNTVKRFGAGTEVQSSLKDTAHPLLVLTSENHHSDSALKVMRVQKKRLFLFLQNYKYSCFYGDRLIGSLQWCD